MKKTALCTVLGIEYPIIQAPMAWITPAEFAAAVSNAGGLGTIGPMAGIREPREAGDAEMVGERLREQIRKARSLTDKPFSANVPTVCGTLKEGIKGLEKDLGLFVAGGKGKTSRQTPAQITAFGEAISLDPGRWSTPAACPPRWTAPPFRMATSFIITFSCSPQPAPGRRCSRARTRPIATPAANPG